MMDEKRRRDHICIWCKKVLFTKPLGTTPTDEEVKKIAEHIMSCAENPVVQKNKELETEIKRLTEVVDGYNTLNGELSVARRGLEDGIKEIIDCPEEYSGYITAVDIKTKLRNLLPEKE